MAGSQSLLMAFLSVVVLVEGGVVPDVPENRIVGGHPIVIADAPWQVRRYLNEKSKCGGSIISNWWVLTAAHCTFGLQPSQIKILAGSNSLTDGGLHYYIEKVINHEKYINGVYINDISVIKTASKIKLDPPVKAVQLPVMEAMQPPVGTKLRVSGWGLTEDGKYPALLRAVDVVVIDYEECNIYTSSDNATQICAGLPGKGSCSGDSGGPLMMGDLQVGIVSYGMINETCGNRSSVYTSRPTEPGSKCTQKCSEMPKLR